MAARSFTKRRNSGVSIWSALMALTRMPSLPSSTAATRIAWRSAALLPPYAAASRPGAMAAIDTAELEYGLPDEAREALIVTNVQRDSDGAARVRCSDLSRDRVRGRAVEIGHDDVRALFRETPGRGRSDT